MKLFGTDGIRNEYGSFPLDTQTIIKIGSALAKTLDSKIKKILIAHDGRESCNLIYENLVKGVNFHSKYEIIFLDLLPTPAVSYILSNNKDNDAYGIEITASHNPYTDNGIKIFNNYGFKISSSHEDEIERLVDNQDEEIDNSSIECSSGNSLRVSYINFISKIFPNKDNPKQSLKIAVDCANGAISNIINDLNIPENMSLVLLNNTPNGRNINNNCGAVYPEFLSNFIRESNTEKTSQNFDFGMCFDGDGDRAILVDNLGNILDGDDLLYIFALYSGEINKVVGTVMTNYGIRKNLERIGIDFIETDVGDKNVLQAVLENNAFIGSESSGHIIHTDTGTIPIGDGLITMAKIINLVSEKKKSVSELYPMSKKIPSILINIETLSADKYIETNESIFTKVKKMLGNSGRIFVRKSGTQQLVRILIEHESEQILSIVEKEIREIM